MQTKWAGGFAFVGPYTELEVPVEVISGCPIDLNPISHLRSTITVLLKEVGVCTRMELRHVGFPLVPGIGEMIFKACAAPIEKLDVHLPTCKGQG